MPLPSTHVKSCQSKLLLNPCQDWWMNQQSLERFKEIVRRGNLLSHVIPTCEIKCAFIRLPSSPSRHSNHIKWALIIVAKKAGWPRTECRHRRSRMHADGNWRRLFTSFQLWALKCVSVSNYTYNILTNCYARVNLTGVCAWHDEHWLALMSSNTVTI